jgi:hypothetical protein
MSLAVHPEANRVRAEQHDEPDEWLLQNQAKSLMPTVGDSTFKSLVASGRLTTLKVPGSRLRVSRRSIERFLRECVREAKRPELDACANR